MIKISVKMHDCTYRARELINVRRMPHDEAVCSCRIFSAHRIFRDYQASRCVLEECPIRSWSLRPCMILMRLYLFLSSTIRPDYTALLVGLIFQLVTSDNVLFFFILLSSPCSRNYSCKRYAITQIFLYF